MIAGFGMVAAGLVLERVKVEIRALNELNIALITIQMNMFQTVSPRTGPSGDWF
jgi:hypothetical protein